MAGELNEFLVRNRIDQETWERSGCSWDDLKEISIDHAKQYQMLCESAAMYANLIQKISGVHSVRWRIKDVEHLLEKIVRKKAGLEEKYKEINPKNYFEIVTDLIGIRALHLFKEDCFGINDSLKSMWESAEDPISYIRNGDPEELIEKYKERNLRVMVHPAGYRSVHYVISSRPMNRLVFAEIQIRTIFEEGWSEIDHKIRYPNFSDNEFVGIFLSIFNRMAGSADEMGSFVKDMTASIDSYQLEAEKAIYERDQGLKRMEELLTELGQLKQQDEKSREKILKLQEQVEKMKSERIVDYHAHDPLSEERIQNLLGYSAAERALRGIDFSRNLTRTLPFRDASGLSRVSDLAKYVQQFDPNKLP